MDLKNHTFEACLKNKDKKFHWRFGEKKIKGVKTPVIYLNYEHQGRMSKVTEDWLRLDKPEYWEIFKRLILKSVGRGYTIVYSGKKGIKESLVGKGIKVGF